MRNYKHLVFAGTFDRLHIGHKKLLDMAFELAEKVSIGITTENLYKSKPLANLIQTEAVRRRLVEQYLRQRNWLKRANFFSLDDIYGPSTSLRVKPAFDSILVTDWTKKNAEKINEIRVRRYLKPLRIIVAPLVRGDDGEVITSERIRLGEIDREGKSYWLLVNSYLNKGKKDLLLPRYLRAELRKPLGLVVGGSVNQLAATAKKVIKFIKSIKFIKTPMVITVGDIVTLSLLEIGFEPDVKIIDLRSRRKNINSFDSAAQFFITRESHHSDFVATVPSKVKKIASASSNYLNQQVSKNFSSPSYLEVEQSFLRIFNRGKNFDCLNEPGTVNLKTSKFIQQAIKKFLNKKQQSWIVIKGEEDLLALPAILFAPLHSVVLYGQIDLGVVVVTVTEEKKREVEKILSKFS